MFCGNCGAKLEDDSTFCSECGAKVEKPEFLIRNLALDPIPDQGTAGTQPKPKLSERWKAMDKKQKSVCAVIAAAVICGAAVWWYNSGIVRLDSYVDVEFTGYDGIGHAQAVFDREAFMSDYGNKVKLKAKSDNFLEELSDSIENSALEAVSYECIDYELDKTDHLKNGDEVTLTWDCDDSAFEELCGKKLKYSEQVFTAEGLEKLELIDPFEKIEIGYNGISSEGYISVETPADSEEYIQNLWYSVEPDYNLSNGDTVRVSINNYDEEYYAEEYGIGFSSTEKTYTVSGLGEYVSGAADISEDMLEQMISQGTDELTAYAAKNWSGSLSLDGVEYIGNYFLKAKGNDSYLQNKLILVYKVDSTITVEESGEQTAVSYYTCIMYSNIIKENDEIIVDLQQYDRCSDSFDVEVDAGGWWPLRYWYNGYQNPDELYQRMVVTCSDEFTSEDNVND